MIINKVTAGSEPDNETFHIGEKVLVIPSEDGSDPTQEFVGVVIGTKDGKYIQVKDQDSNVFDCDPTQIHSIK